jgi:hypothetical protein
VGHTARFNPRSGEQVISTQTTVVRQSIPPRIGKRLGGERSHFIGAVGFAEEDVADATEEQAVGGSEEMLL